VSSRIKSQTKSLQKMFIFIIIKNFLKKAHVQRYGSKKLQFNWNQIKNRWHIILDLNIKMVFIHSIIQCEYLWIHCKLILKSFSMPLMQATQCDLNLENFRVVTISNVTLVVRSYTARFSWWEGDPFARICWIIESFWDNTFCWSQKWVCFTEISACFILWFTTFTVIFIIVECISIRFFKQ